MIQGTPVIDIKPYIAEYDSPCSTISPKEQLQEISLQEENGDVNCAVLQKNNPEYNQERSPQDDSRSLLGEEDTSADKHDISDIKCNISANVIKGVALETSSDPSLIEGTCSLQGFSSKQFVEDFKTLQLSQDFPSDGTTSIIEPKDKPSTSDSFVAKWVTDSPVPSLTVRFTPHAERELRQFKPPCESGEPSFRFFQSFEEAKYAITSVLSADPRSVYRRNQCLDRLFYFSFDTIHITCWFGDGFAEVLKIQHVAENSKN